MPRLVSLEDLIEKGGDSNSLPSGIICLWHGLPAYYALAFIMKLA